MSTTEPDPYGVTPQVQEGFIRAAQSLRQAITATEEALKAAADGSDVQSRCNEALDSMEEALAVIEWVPPPEEPQS